ncbi:hypothetical protein ANCDUO_17548, partial [Ancylostoma duodenale]
SRDAIRYVLEKGDSCFTEYIGRNGGHQDIIIGSECAEVSSLLLGRFLHSSCPLRAVKSHHSSAADFISLHFTSADVNQAIILGFSTDGSHFSHAHTHVKGALCTALSLYTTFAESELVLRAVDVQDDSRARPSLSTHTRSR